jgi:hypothetical protein
MEVRQKLQPEIATSMIMNALVDEVKPLLAQSHLVTFDATQLRQRLPQVRVRSKSEADLYFGGQGVYLIVGCKPAHRRRQSPSNRKPSKRRRPSFSSSDLEWHLYTGCSSKSTECLSRHRSDLRRRRRGEPKAERDLFLVNTLGPDPDVS